MKLKVSTWLAMCVAQVKTSAWLFPCSYQFGMQFSSHTSSPDMCSSPSLSESDVLKSEQFCFWNADTCNCHSAEWNIFALNFIQFFHEIIKHLGGIQIMYRVMQLVCGQCTIFYSRCGGKETSPGTMWYWSSYWRIEMQWWMDKLTPKYEVMVLISSSRGLKNICKREAHSIYHHFKW